MIEKIRKYNFWDGNDIPMGYARTAYLQQIKSVIGTNLVKVLVGQRRIGKSYILRQIAQALIKQGIPAKNIFYVNKEFMEFGTIVTAEDLQNLYEEYRQKITPEGRVYLFLDEIQYIEHWEQFVNSHSQDFADPCELFISGSNSELLSGELATLLSGRYIQFEVFSYAFSEYCNITHCEIGKSAYLQYLHTGALPELLNLNLDEMRRNYVLTIKDTVMLRDIIRRYRIKDFKLLDDLFIYLINNASSLLSISNIVHYFTSKKRTTNYETLSHYLLYLQNSFLIHPVERFNIKGKEVIAGNCKYYINDLAFYNYLYSGFGYSDGYLLENAVYLELRRQGYDVYVGQIRDKEIDFVAMKGDKHIYLQVCLELSSEATRIREYDSLRLVKDNYHKYVVSLDDYPIASKQGIEHRLPWNLDNL